MQCDMCGNNTNLVVAIIEETELNVCNKCAKFGKTLRVIREPPKKKKNKEPKDVKIEIKPEVIQVITEDYAQKIRNARSAIFPKQEDFAKKINEKLSVIQSLESGKHPPPLKLARKLEQALKIKLIEQHEEKPTKASSGGGAGFTIGDLIKVKK